MPLRYNARELAILAGKASECFDKEGALLMKDKQEGLFRKGETYVERLFRLRGNLLFYFKTRAPSSEVLGVYVLERCMVQLEMDDAVRYGFVIMFEGEDKPLQLSASSESDRAGWIEGLHIASYECMKMQMQSLREQLRGRTGKDPMDEQKDILPGEGGGGTTPMGEPLMEMGIACERLPRDQSGKVPDSFVAVHYSTPQKQHWFPLGHTELVAKSASPGYLTTVGVYSQSLLKGNTKIKLMVYDVRERMTSTMALLGTAVFVLEDLTTTPGSLLSLPLESVESTDAGFITIHAWKRKENVEIKKAKKLDILERFYDNLQTKSYRFPSNFGKDLYVHEYLAESRLCFSLPVQLLKLWVEEEKQQNEQLQDLGELGEPFEVTRKELLDYHMSTVLTYMQNIKYLSTYQGAPFKPSAKKSHKEVEFAPTNLHLQRLWVQNPNRMMNVIYDVTTVGAFTAFALKYKHGGLRRLQEQLMEATTCNGLGSPVKNVSNQYNAAVVMNQIGAAFVCVNQLCEDMCRAALQGDARELENTLEKLQTETKRLVQYCANPLVEEGVEEHGDSRCSTPSSPQVSPPEGSWKWSGTDFIKSPTEEPWDLTRLNTEAALVCVISMVEDLVKDESTGAQWLDKLSTLMIKLKSCVQVMCQRAKSGLVFISVKACSGHVPLLHTIKYRRDVCFSQSMTALVSAFAVQFHSRIDEHVFLRQLHCLGALVQCEGLLSCYTSEMGMIQDMAVAVSSLRTVSFKIIEAVDADQLLPTITSNNMVCPEHFPDMSRSGYIVTIPVPEAAFHRLPPELQLGQLIKVHPIFFNIGINEQATLAEKIGDLSLQEDVNEENYNYLHDYYKAFTAFTKDEDVEVSSDLEQQMRILHMEVMSKKQKNVQLLHLAADISRYMQGIRMTSCKSAKDRTSMSVTLEQVQLLLKDHDLSKTLYMQALDCMRSEGLRRENVHKNTGSRKYAFNSLQLLSIPKLYRPPSGTYGNNQT